MTTLKETDILRPVVEHFRSMTGFDVYQEVYVRLGDSNRRIDLIADDGLTLIACEGKAQLDDVVIEQARTLQGVSDVVYVVVPRLARDSTAFSARAETCEELGIGVITIQDGSIYHHAQPRRNANADTSKLRAACTDPQKDFADAGSKSEGWTAEKAWFRAFEEELERGPIRTGHVLRVVDCKSPWRSNRLAIRAIKDAIHDGRVAAEVRGVEFHRTNGGR